MIHSVSVQNGPSLMVSPKSQTAVHGEATIARYLARLLNPSYDSDDICRATEIDNYVDLAYLLTNGKTKEKDSVLKTLNAKLGKSEWLVGSQQTLADIVLWSAVHQSGQAKSAPANVKKWLSRCSDDSAFRTALKFVQ